MKDKTTSGSKLVSSAVIGYDFRRVVINGKTYTIMPPTIHRIAGAAYWLEGLGEGDTVKELLQGMKDLGNLCRALSFFIAGDESLTEELSQGTISEVASAVEEAFQMLDTQGFIKLSALTRSAARLIARQRP